MKAIIIARVSTEEQREAGNSLPAQIERLKRYCQIKSFEIVKEFSFDESAYKTQRDEFDSIIDFVIKQNEKVVVCFDKVDRLSRSIFDKRVHLLYEKALCDEIELHFASDGQRINSQISAAEKFQFSMSLGLSKYYSDAISDNVKRAIEQKLRSGEWPGRASFGYKNITKLDGKKDIVVDENASQIAQKAFELYATGGFSMGLLCTKLNAEYGLKWRKGFIGKILNDPFYYGFMVCKNKLYPHRYTPIITKTLFDQVQQVISGFNKKRFKYAGKPYIYRGIFRCGHCGLSMTPEKHKGLVYYHCTQYNGKHGTQWLREEAITEQLGHIFKQMQIPEEILLQTINALNTAQNDNADFQAKNFEELTQKHKTVTKMRSNLYMDKLKGRITENEYDNFDQGFREEIADLDSQLGMLQETDDNYYITSKYVLDLTNQAYDLFVSSEVEKRRQLLCLVLQNLRVEGKKVRFEAKKPFNLILDFVDGQRWLPEQDADRTFIVDIFMPDRIRDVIGPVNYQVS